MPRLPSVRSNVARILEQETARLEEQSKIRSLDDGELSKLQKILTLDALVTTPGEQRGEVAQDELDKIVDELKPKRAPELFPKRGPKASTKVYESDTE